MALVVLSSIQIACAQNTTSQNKQCRSHNLNHAQHFNQMYKKDEFYIFYSTLSASPHRLKTLKDLNNNKIPDYIEDLATQAIASREIFKAAGFRHPLQSPRYQNVENISIFVQDLKGNGIAYEVPAVHPNLKHHMPCSLVMHISIDLKDFPGNYWTTVTHELFHLYQYGYTQFKNTWYLESLANWSERALRIDLSTGTKNLPALPKNTLQLNKEVISKGYHHMWRRLAVIESQDRLVIPPHLQDMHYTNGSSVFKDNEWRNTSLVLNVMQNLEHTSLNMSKQRKWHPYNWKEADQRLKSWDPIIWQNIQAAFKTQGYQTTEVKLLLKLDLQP